MTDKPINQKVEEGGDLVDCLLILSRIYGDPISRDSAISGIPLTDHKLTPKNFHRSAERARISSKVEKRTLGQIDNALLPSILLLKDENACVLTKVDVEKNQAEVILPRSPDSVSTIPIDKLLSIYEGIVIYTKPNIKLASLDEKDVLSQKSSHWLWGPISENKPLYRDIIVASFFINLFAVAMPLFVMNVYDRVVPNHAIDTLWVLTFGVFIVLMADLALRISRNWLVDLAASRADLKISSKIISQSLGIKMKNRTQTPGSFSSGVQSFESVRSFIGSASVTAMIDLPFAVLFTFIIFLINWQMAIPIVIGSTLVISYAFIAQRGIGKLSESSQKAHSTRNSILVESLSSIESVKSFSSEGKIQSAWEQACILISKINTKMKFLSSTVTNGALWVQHVVAVSIVIIGVHLIIAGDLTQGALIASYLLSSRAMSPVSQTASLISQFNSASTSMKALNEVMSLEVDRPDSKQWIDMPEIKGSVEFKNVYFNYPDEEKPSLSGVSFKIKNGERVAILGRNGSGKSTIEKLVIGLFEPQKGSILIDGVDSRQYDPSQIRRSVGYVPQDISLFNGTLKDNIKAANPCSTDEHLIHAASIAGLTNVVNHHPNGFNLHVGDRGSSLSGGQKQSVAIARCVIKNPPIILMDEPTAALDHSTEHDVVNRLSDFTKGKTVIIVTHRNTLLSLVDRIIVLDNGKVVADGEKESVLVALKQGKIGAGS